MSNNTTTTNVYADTIAENRFIASAQLTADDMGPTAWKQYRQLCDNIAISAWKSITTTDNDNIIGLSLSGLFAFFGSDAKATVPMQKRLLLACVAIKKCQSDAMKKARKALRNAKIALENFDPDAPVTVTTGAPSVLTMQAMALAIKEGNNEAYDKTKAIADKEMAVIAVTKESLEQAVADAEAEVARLKSEPNNEWYEKTPMLDKTKKHANAKCRKLIEDTIADILTERSLMTVEELQEEALALKAARKAKKQMAKAEAKAEETKTESESESTTESK